MTDDVKPSKRALVTGGSGGLGRAICEQLAKDGLHVIVHANKALVKAQAVVDAILAQGGSAEAVSFDVTNRVATAEALETLGEAGSIQVLVNNAGIHDDVVFPGMSGDQWDRVIDVSLNGFFNVTQPLSMPMLRTRWGRVINISSVSAVAGNRGQVNYAAAKGALHAASKSLALEMASRGVTVNGEHGASATRTIAPNDRSCQRSTWCSDMARMSSSARIRYSSPCTLISVPA